jgi:hypothetical protein
VSDKQASTQLVEFDARPTPEGGRRLDFTCPYGHFMIESDARGALVAHTIIHYDPDKFIKDAGLQQTPIPQVTNTWWRTHRGLGDTIAWALYKMGIKPKPGCGCKKRQRLLNGMMPYDRGPAKWLQQFGLVVRRLARKSKPLLFRAR